MKIAIIGTHGTGKTTLCNQLSEYLMEEGMNVGTVTELIRRSPFLANEDTTRESQEWVLLNQIKEENASKEDVIISDRSVLDNYAYLYRHLGKDDDELNQIMLDHLKTYDILFWSKIRRNAKADGFRSLNEKFRVDIEEIIHNKLNELKDYLNANNVQVKEIESFEDIKNLVWGMIENGEKHNTA